MRVSFKVAFACIGVIALSNQGVFGAGLSKSTVNKMMEVLEGELELLRTGSCIEESTSDIAALIKRFERFAQKCHFGQSAVAGSFGLSVRCQQKTPPKSGGVFALSREDEEELRLLAGRIMYLRRKQDDARKRYIECLISMAALGIGMPALMIAGGYVLMNGWPSGQENSRTNN